MRKVVLLAGAVVTALGASGCQPFSMGIVTPVPMPPWVTERMEEKYCHKNDYRTTILPPIPDGAPPPICEDPPSIGEVLRAMPHVKRGVMKATAANSPTRVNARGGVRGAITEDASTHTRPR